LIVALSKSGIIGYVLLGIEIIAIVMGFASQFLIFNDCATEAGATKRGRGGEAEV